MMNKLTFIIAAFVLAQNISKAQDLTLDEIMNKYYKENSIDKLKKINSIIMTGTITRSDLMPYKLTRKRPDKLRIDFELADLEAIQAFDGKAGWSTAPWTGNPNPTMLPDDALNTIKARADFDGILYQWKDKGHSAELIGKEMLGDKETYKIKITRKDGGKEFYFIGSKDFILYKQTVYRINKGKELEIETEFKDYRKIQDIWFAFANKINMGGQPYSEIEYETIEIDKPVDDKIFEMPLK